MRTKPIGDFGDTQTEASPFPALLIKLEEWMLSAMLGAMILLACYQIGLRWFTAGGLSWIDPLVRYLVLWSGMMGAVLATARDQHITLDIAGFMVSGTDSGRAETACRTGQRGGLIFSAGGQYALCRRRTGVSHQWAAWHINLDLEPDFFPSPSPLSCSISS
jgi:hypothetical protein